MPRVFAERSHGSRECANRPGRPPRSAIKLAPPCKPSGRRRSLARSGGRSRRRRPSMWERSHARIRAAQEGDGRGRGEARHARTPAIQRPGTSSAWIVQSPPGPLRHAKRFRTTGLATHALIRARAVPPAYPKNPHAMTYRGGVWDTQVLSSNVKNASPTSGGHSLDAPPGPAQWSPTRSPHASPSASGIGARFAGVNA